MHVYMQWCTPMHTNTVTAREEQDCLWLLYAPFPASYAISSLPLRLLWFHIPMGDRQAQYALIACNVGLLQPLG